jgi:signal peptidase I
MSYIPVKDMPESSRKQLLELLNVNYPYSGCSRPSSPAAVKPAKAAKPVKARKSAKPASPEKSSKKQFSGKKAFNYFTWAITGVLGVLIAGFVFVQFVPGYSMYFVRSDSMKPLISAGDLIITGPQGNLLTGDIKEGSVVSFKRGKDMVTHRVVEVKGSELVTRGDANEEIDSRTTAMSSVSGVYMMKIPYLGFLSSLVSSRQGWFMVIVLPTMLLVSWLVYEILRECFKNEKVSVNRRKT